MAAVSHSVRHRPASFDPDYPCQHHRLLDGWIESACGPLLQILAYSHRVRVAIIDSCESTSVVGPLGVRTDDHRTELPSGRHHSKWRSGDPGKLTVQPLLDDLRRGE